MDYLNSAAHIAGRAILGFAILAAVGLVLIGLLAAWLTITGSIWHNYGDASAAMWVIISASVVLIAVVWSW